MAATTTMMKDQQQQETLDMSTAIESLVQFCTDINVGTGTEDECLMKVIVCNMQYIKKEHLYAKLFGESSYCNWDVIETKQKRMSLRKKGNCLGTTVTWYHLLKFLNGNKVKLVHTHTHILKLLIKILFGNYCNLVLLTV